MTKLRDGDGKFKIALLYKQGLTKPSKIVSRSSVEDYFKTEHYKYDWKINKTIKIPVIPEFERYELVRNFIFSANLRIVSVKDYGRKLSQMVLSDLDDPIDFNMYAYDFGNIVQNPIFKPINGMFGFSGEFMFYSGAEFMIAPVLK